MLRYLFRKPIFPIICDIDNFVIGAKSERDFVNKISGFEFSSNSYYNVIDVTGEGWLFSPELMAISPLTFQKRWTKKELINLVNHRKNKSYPIEYPLKLHKRVDVIITELVQFLEG